MSVNNLVANLRISKSSQVCAHLLVNVICSSIGGADYLVTPHEHIAGTIHFCYKFNFLLIAVIFIEWFALAYMH